jgi:hypothetical protein
MHPKTRICSLFMCVYVLGEEIVICPGYGELERSLRSRVPCDPNIRMCVYPSYFLVARGSKNAKKLLMS